MDTFDITADKDHVQQTSSYYFSPTVALCKDFACLLFFVCRYNRQRIALFEAIIDLEIKTVNRVGEDLG